MKLGNFMTVIKIKKSILFLFIIWIIIFLFQSSVLSRLSNQGDTRMKLTSTAFKEGGLIPKKYTCDDEDLSPPLTWENIPEKTKQLALICEDPDAPMGIWVHWVVYKITPGTERLDENTPPDKNIYGGAVQGVNDFGRIGYGGPCPPGGTHRYFFKLYALDTFINLEPGATKASLLKAMQGHILEETRLMGKYKRG